MRGARREGVLGLIPPRAPPTGRADAGGGRCGRVAAMAGEISDNLPAGGIPRPDATIAAPPALEPIRTGRPHRAGVQTQRGLAARGEAAQVCEGVGRKRRAQ